MVYAVAGKHTKTRQELIDLNTDFGAVLASDPEAAERYFSDPDNPFCIGIDGVAGGGKSLLNDTILAGLCPENSEEFLEPKTGMRAGVESATISIGGKIFEVQFKNVNQTLETDGLFGRKRIVFNKMDQLREMNKQRQFGGITILQNVHKGVCKAPGEVKFFEKTLSVSLFLSRAGKVIPRGSRKTRRRAPAHAGKIDLSKEWGRHTNFRLHDDKLESFSGFPGFWAGLDFSERTL